MKNDFVWCSRWAGDEKQLSMLQWPNTHTHTSHRYGQTIIPSAHTCEGTLSEHLARFLFQNHATPSGCKNLAYTCKNLTCTGKNLIYFLPCKNHARLCSKIRQESCMLTRFLQDLGKILERSCIKSWQDLGKIFDRDIITCIIINMVRYYGYDWVIYIYIWGNSLPQLNLRYMHIVVLPSFKQNCLSHKLTLINIKCVYYISYIACF